MSCSIIPTLSGLWSKTDWTGYTSPKDMGEKRSAEETGTWPDYSFVKTRLSLPAANSGITTIRLDVENGWEWEGGAVNGMCY